MSQIHSTSDQLKDFLAQTASRVTGIRPDALRVGAIETLFRGIKGGVQEGAEVGLPRPEELLSSLTEAVPVGETYFFRQLEHFRYLESEILPSISSRPLRVWSAGCASGEEAYSLASCLAASPVFSKADFEVLGTDLSLKHLEKAQKGIYQSWSLRSLEGEPYPLFEKKGAAGLQVAQRLRDACRFFQHNLLEPLPLGEGPFDLVFCRNVLVYFTPEAVLAALGNILSHLSPGGLLFLGPTDLPFAPPDLKPCGPAGLSIYQKKASFPSPRKTVRAIASKEKKPKEGAKPARNKTKPHSGPVPLHLRILRDMEKENPRDTHQRLAHLRQSFPDYLPGLFEEALWNARNGHPSDAGKLLRDLLRKLKGKDRQEVLAGPQGLTVEYYMVSAQAYLENGERS